MPLSEFDLAEIERISRKKSVRKVAHAVINSLDKDTLSTLISTFLVLKAHGHPDSDLIRYLATKKTGKTLKLGFKAGGPALSSIISDSEFRSLMLRARQQMNKQKQEALQKGERVTPKKNRIVMVDSSSQMQ
jgi:hypothetical protein